MKRLSVKQYIFSVALALVFSLVTAQSVSAATYEPGTLVTPDSHPAVFYIASDNYRYLFPDAATYYSWYGDFSAVETGTARQVKSHKKAKHDITIRPGSRLVQFAGSPKVFAVSSGATLRWVENETVARHLYGNNWVNDIVVLPADNVSIYTMGESISHSSQYDRATEYYRTTVNKELEARGVLKTQTTKSYYTPASRRSSVQGPLLSRIQENLDDSLSPSFRPTVTEYRIHADYDETLFKIRPYAYNSAATVAVNGTNVPRGEHMQFHLAEGRNTITITVTLNNESLKYTLTVYRDGPSENAQLRSLSESLKDSLSPRFDEDVYSYRITARAEEEVIVLTPRAKEKTSFVQVNGKRVEHGNKIAVQLDKGHNTIHVKAYSQDGTRRVYTIHVDRERTSNQSDASLTSISENLRDSFDVRFDPNTTGYFISANENEDDITIRVRTKSRDAEVEINGSDGKSKTITLSEGRNKIEIEVKSDTGQRKTYYVTVLK